MKKITLEEAQALFKAQGVANNDVAFTCPVCATVQSMRSLVLAGATPEQAETMIAFSCEGRFRNAGPWPGDQDRSARALARRQVRGCDWTLGGLFTIHTLEIVFPDGRVRPSFEIATPEEAGALTAELEGRQAA